MIDNPPFSQVAEQAVIGSILEQPESLRKVSFIGPNDFYMRPHRLIFEMMLEVDVDGKPADLVTIGNMVDDETGGISYLQDIWKNTPSAKNIVAYANEVLDLSIRRAIIAESLQCSEDMQNVRGNYLADLEQSTARINEQVSRKSHGNVMTIDELIGESIDEMDRSSRNIKTGLSTGIVEVDERLGDMLLAFGEITILGGLSKNGKTLLANTITARLQLDEDEVGHIFSIEMTSAAMFNAVISARTGIPANFYRKQDYYARVYHHQYDEMYGKWANAAKELKESRKFKFDGKKEVDADYICSEMRKQAALAQVAGKKLRYVLIDHMHRMNYHNDNGPMTYAIRDAIRKIKNTASDLGVAVLMLAQLNNRAEGNDPTSFHILDSSSARHEMQAFIGVRMYRHNGNTFFGIFADSQRYADIETKHTPAYMILIGGVLSSLPEHMSGWTPVADEMDN